MFGPPRALVSLHFAEGLQWCTQAVLCEGERERAIQRITRNEFHALLFKDLRDFAIGSDILTHEPSDGPRAHFPCRECDM